MGHSEWVTLRTGEQVLLEQCFKHVDESPCTGN